MAKRTQNAPDHIIVSVDPGNGSIKACTTARKDYTMFEPIVAPITYKKHAGDSKKTPKHSLKVDDSVFVFGYDDVTAHGQTALARRLNSAERYGGDDYMAFIGVALLHALAMYRGDSDQLAPYLVISLPIEQYNNQDMSDKIAAMLVGTHELVDAESCALRLRIKADHLLILPESFGALVDHAWDSDAGMVDPKEVAGSTLVADVGYETTDVSYYIGTAYQRDAATTIPRAGMGIIARQIAEYARTSNLTRAADVNYIDRSMQKIAGKNGNRPLVIELAPGVGHDVSGVYLPAIHNLAQTIAQEVLTRFSGGVTRLLLTGGGARHLHRYMRDMLPFPTIVNDDPELANVRGGLSYQIAKLERGNRRR